MLIFLINKSMKSPAKTPFADGKSIVLGRTFSRRLFSLIYINLLKTRIGIVKFFFYDDNQGLDLFAAAPIEEKFKDIFALREISTKG
jgi:hypothetical protein